MKKSILIFVAILLAINFLYCHSHLLLVAKKLALDMLDTDKLDAFNTVIQLVVALTYSVLTAVLIIKIDNFKFIVPLALFDAVAVYLRINVYQDNFLKITAIYYSLYSFYLVCLVFVLANQKYKIFENQQQPTEKPKKEKKIDKTKIETPKTEVKSLPATDIEENLYNSIVKKINGSGKNPEKIKYFIETCTHQKLKQRLIETYNYYG